MFNEQLTTALHSHHTASANHHIQTVNFTSKQTHTHKDTSTQTHTSDKQKLKDATTTTNNIKPCSTIIRNQINKYTEQNN